MSPPTIKSFGNIITVALVLAVSLTFHGFNFFNFPYYENDEGVYLSQAWSFLNQGKLAPYTYWYDHSPFGWIFTSMWLFLSGGLFTFGFSLNSGRVFMLILQLLSTLFVYRIAVKLTGSRLAAVISSLIFSVSPLGIYFHRRLLLDNIMTFWFLMSYDLILGSHRRLIHFIISAIAFGFAILSKENAIFFAPGFLFAFIFNVHQHHKRFVIIKWFTLVGLIVSTYFLYALLKGELFPYGSRFGGDSPHVSLMETLSYQLSRPGGSIFDPGSTFWHNFRLWLRQDALIVIVGLICNLALVFISLFRQKSHYFALSLFGLLFWYFLGRGGVVIEFYIVPLLPVLSLCIGVYLFELVLAFNHLIPYLPRRFLLFSLLVTVGLCYSAYYSFNHAYGQYNTFYYLFHSRQTQSQLVAVDWIRRHVPSGSFVVIDNYAYLDLHAPDNPSGITFNQAHWYWKVDLDPEISRLADSPDRIDYIAKTPQMEGDLIMGSSPTTSAALDQSSLVWGEASDGWGVEIWATRYPRQILQQSWISYVQNFIESDGRVTDPAKGNVITSEGQSYAMLRSVWQDDQTTFESVWNWTKNNLQMESGVFAWKWDDIILDSGSASDADTDIALSLLFASKRFSRPEFLSDAQKIIAAIWQSEVRQFSDNYYLVPGNWAVLGDSVIINPSYLFPSAYRLFAAVDPVHPWVNLVDTSYQVIDGCSRSSLDQPLSVYLTPNWCQLNPDGSFAPATVSGLESTEYSYDALRTPWRVALDHLWFRDPRAKDYLTNIGNFFIHRLTVDGKILVGYTHEGQPWENYESVTGYATALAGLMVVSPETAADVYRLNLHSKFYIDSQTQQNYWEDPRNYYAQNWAWFGTALYSLNLPNLSVDQ